MKNICIVLLFFTYSFPIFAAEKTKFVNGSLGVSVEMSSGHESAFTFGGRAGADAFDFESGNIAFGIGSQRAVKEYKYGTAVAELGVTWLNGEVIFRKAWDTGLYGGIRGGLSFIHIDVSGNGRELAGNGTSFSFGPVIGHELKLAEKLYFTTEFSWMNVGSGEIDAIGAKIPYEKSSFLLFQGGILFDWQ